MLSGEILNRAPLSVALLPPPSLIELCKAMAAIATLANQQNIDDDDIYLENGLLSYENPNYHMDPHRIERNSHLYEEILSELQQQGSLRNNISNLVSNRKDYARLDIGSMGVDLKENFGSTEKKSLYDAFSNDSKIKSDDVQEKTDERTKDDDCNNYVNQQHQIERVPGKLNADDLYTLPSKKSGQDNKLANGDTNSNETTGKQQKLSTTDAVDGIEDKDFNNDLPPGWEKHEDNDGPYYWHIKSGTIQREPPVWPKDKIGDLKTPIASLNPQQFLYNLGAEEHNNKNHGNQFCVNKDNISQHSMGENQNQSVSVTRSNTSSALDQEDDRRRREDLAYKRRSYPLKSESTERPIRFAVRSLGWVEIAEEDLTPERSSKAVNKCIVDLSLGRNDLLDVVGRWGDGKDLFMDLDEGALKLIDPENLTILNTQPIHTIRVWGVGRDNGRDFAYVARDRLTRIHMCHVFRCDTAARTIANTLRDICKKIMIERSLQLDSNNHCMGSNKCVTRPTDLPTENRRWIRHPQSFPTPMEEPKKVLKAQYLGAQEVINATGIEALNAAIDQVVGSTKHEEWENVNVSVAPSMISIYTSGSGDEARLISECRVRYLSFLGIGKNVKNCAFIMHTAQDKFVAHVFHCEPSSGALCKTIEAACKLRYQKCLDAHPDSRFSSDLSSQGKGISATLKNLMNTFALKKDKVSS